MRKFKLLSVIITSALMLLAASVFHVFAEGNKFEYGTVTITVIDEETNDLFNENRNNFELTGGASISNSSDQGASEMGGAILAGQWNSYESNPYVLDKILVGCRYSVKYIGMDYGGYSYHIDYDRSEYNFDMPDSGPKEITIYMKKHIWNSPVSNTTNVNNTSVTTTASSTTTSSALTSVKEPVTDPRTSTTVTVTNEPRDVVYTVISYPSKTVYTVGEDLDLSGIAVKCHSETYWHTEDNSDIGVIYGEPYVVDNITLDPKDAWIEENNDDAICTHCCKGNSFSSLKPGKYTVSYGESYKYGDKEIYFCDFTYDVSIEPSNADTSVTNTVKVKVLDINGDTLIVKPEEGSKEYKYSNRFAISVKNIDSGSVPYAGMKLEIAFSGDLLAIYPAKFDEINEITVISDAPDIFKGDVNCDEQVDMADAVLIMQALANPNKYGENGTNFLSHLTALGRLNGDMDGDGLTVSDALAIQKKLLGMNETADVRNETVIDQYIDQSHIVSSYQDNTGINAGSDHSAVITGRKLTGI